MPLVLDQLATLNASWHAARVSAGREMLGPQQLTGLALLSRALEHQLVLRLAVERLEEVVVRAGQNVTRRIK
jgi:hypothetical protein